VERSGRTGSGTNNEGQVKDEWTEGPGFERNTAHLRVTFRIQFEDRVRGVYQRGVRGTGEGGLRRAIRDTVARQLLGRLAGGKRRMTLAVQDKRTLEYRQIPELNAWLEPRKCNNWKKMVLSRRTRQEEGGTMYSTLYSHHDCS
jgi:hypothetical protein